MLLQVRRVRTVISRTEMQCENAIDKSKMRFKCGFGFELEKVVAQRTQRASLELQTLKTCQNNNQTIHKAQRRTVGYGAKRLVNLIILQVVSLFLLRSNNSTMRTLQ